MQRLIFWGTIILFVAIVGLVIDQIFYWTMRIFFTKHTANIIRLWAFVTTFVVIVVAGFVGHYYTRTHVNINNVEVASARLPESFDGFRIAHISDFHIDSFDSVKEMGVVEMIVEKILAEKPDVICFTGDIVTARSAQLIPFRKALKKLAATSVPVFSVMGNHDYADYVWNFDEERRQKDRDSLRLMQKEMGWQMLDNDCRWMRRGADSILVVGVENIGEPPFTTYGDLKKALEKSLVNVGENVLEKVNEVSFSEKEVSSHKKEVSATPFSLLLSHNPTHWRREVLPDTDIDLMLAGHTHSMQFSIFGWSPATWRYLEAAGLYQEGNQFLYVNSGLGCTGPRIRIGVKPEVTIIVLKTK